MSDASPFIGGISASNEIITDNQPSNFVGYMHSLRVSSIARYTEETFNLPVNTYLTDEYTLALLFQTLNIVDESREPFLQSSITIPTTTVTNFGNVAILVQGAQITPTSPLPLTRTYNPSFHNGSVKLNGQNCISVQTGNMDFVDCSWTIEGWFFPENLTNNPGALQTLVSTQDSSNGTPGLNIGILYDDATLTTYVIFNFIDDLGNAYVKYLPTTDYGLFENAWSHFSFVYKNNFIDHGTINPVGMFLIGYLNGKPLMLQDDSFNTSVLNRHDLIIGASYRNSGYTDFFKGFISNVNIHRAALKNKDYTDINTNWLETYTPSREQRDPDGNTAVQLSFNNLSVYDMVGRAAISPYGDIETSEITTKINNSCYKFNGDDSYITISPVTVYDTVFENDFTIEMWVKWSSIDHVINPGVFQMSMSERGFNTNYNTGIGLFVDSNNNNSYTICLNGEDGLSDIRLIPANARASVDSWQHIAIVRSTGRIFFFINGIERDLGQQTYVQPIVSSNICIGNHFDGAKPFRGFIDGFRITKDVARYTSIFDPETFEYTT